MCSYGSKQQSVAIGSCNGLAPHRQQAISCTNADPFHKCMIAASAGLNELIHCGLLMPFAFRNLGQHWSRKRLVIDAKHQAITCTHCQLDPVWTHFEIQMFSFKKIHLKKLICLPNFGINMHDDFQMQHAVKPNNIWPPMLCPMYHMVCGSLTA